MEGTSQDQSHNVITIEHAIVSRIFMACKEQHSWRNVLVGGFETGSRPSRKCKSMQILWVNNLCFFFPSCLFQNRPTEFKDTRNILHTVSLPAFAMFLQDPSSHYVGHLLLANHFGTPTLTSCECSFQPCDDAMAASAPVLYPLLNGRGEFQISRSKIRFFKLFRVQQLQHNLHRICTRLNVFV